MTHCPVTLFDLLKPHLQVRISQPRGISVLKPGSQTQGDNWYPTHRRSLISPFPGNVLRALFGGEPRTRDLCPTSSTRLRNDARRLQMHYLSRLRFN